MDPLIKLVESPRVFVRRKGAPDPEGTCVVYWMRRAQRGEDNPALDVAIEVANALQKPLVVFFALVPVHNANLRHYEFMVQGFADIEGDLRKKNVGFVLRRHSNHRVAKFCDEVHAALLVCRRKSTTWPGASLTKSCSPASNSCVVSGCGRCSPDAVY
jgi:deoxyribodipyrimidine photo-lyase